MQNNTPQILIFRSNIHTEADRHSIKQALDFHPHIDDWTVDIDDKDKVLRVISARLGHKEIVDFVQLHGYSCEELTD